MSTGTLDLRFFPWERVHPSCRDRAGKAMQGGNHPGQDHLCCFAFYSHKEGTTEGTSCLFLDHNSSVGVHARISSDFDQQGDEGLCGPRQTCGKSTPPNRFHI